MSGRYWDVYEARWVPSPARESSEPEPDLPAQRTGLEQVEEADVRSG